jgi:hypothetical protein
MGARWHSCSAFQLEVTSFTNIALVAASTALYSTVCFRFTLKIVLLLKREKEDMECSNQSRTKLQLRVAIRCITFNYDTLCILRYSLQVGRQTIFGRLYNTNAVLPNTSFGH